MATTEQATHKVLVNHEGQYSLWPLARSAPAGWSETGKLGSKEECLAYVDATWTDMRPLSLRKLMERSEELAVE
jgi:MbtH protein